MLVWAKGQCDTLSCGSAARMGNNSIDMEDDLQVTVTILWEMKVSILKMTASMWNILSLCTPRVGAGRYA